MSDLIKVTKICPHRQPNESYKYKDRVATDYEGVTTTESGYEVIYIAQVCAENLCGTWDEVKQCCSFVK